MMLVSPKLRVIHVTTHIGLIDAIARIEPGLVERVIGRAHDTLVKAGVPNPRIGVCALRVRHPVSTSRASSVPAVVAAKRAPCMNANGRKK